MSIEAGVNYQIIFDFLLINGKHPNLYPPQMRTNIAPPPENVLNRFKGDWIAILDKKQLTLYKPVSPQFYHTYIYFDKYIIPRYNLEKSCEISASTKMVEVLLYHDRAHSSKLADGHVKIFRHKNDARDRVVGDLKQTEKIYNTKIAYTLLQEVPKDDLYDFVLFECCAMCSATETEVGYISTIKRILEILKRDGNLMIRIKYLRYDFIEKISMQMLQHFKRITYHNFWVGLRGCIIFEKFDRDNYKDLSPIKPTKEFTNFFTKIYDRATDIKFVRAAENFYKNTICNDGCIDWDTSMQLIKNNCDRQMKKDIELCEEHGFKIRQEYKQGVQKTNSKMLEYAYTNHNERHDLPHNEHMKDYEFKLSKFTNDILRKNENNLKLTKFCIDTRDAKRWGDVTYRINVRRYLNKYIRNKYNITVTRAFTKLYDILTEYDLIDFTRSTTSLHTCEAPGHFINAMNHFIRSHSSAHKWVWYANSLNPNNEENKKKYGSLFGDEYGFIRKYANQWIWGKDGTGDITKEENIRSIIDEFKNKIDIFTSDCGLGATNVDEMLDQENLRSILNYAQVLIGLNVLKLDGHMILKMYLPFNMPITVSLIYLCYLHFADVSIIKQMSGSLGSSEVYLVAMNKREHMTQENMEFLIKHINEYDANVSLFERYDETFMGGLEKISTAMTNATVEYIERSFFYYDNDDILREHERKHFWEAKNKFCEEWIRHNKFKPIKDAI